MVLEHRHSTYAAALSGVGNTNQEAQAAIPITQTLMQAASDAIPQGNLSSQTPSSFQANSMQGGSGVHVAHFSFLATFNLLGNLFLSHDLVDLMSDKASKFFNALTGVAQWFGTPNISDIFPGLRWLDLQSLKRKADRDVRTTLKIVSTLVKERMNEDRRESGKRQESREPAGFPRRRSLPLSSLRAGQK
ncbi:PREDICTED: cytochrome P450 76A2-like [Ipomoea nil]|uniref:cytochrome P450 76A2-like n=1 Tax=Ipomoea nil TaxID=35883 RepID=UPI000900CA3E|nr:PREDICTED: cytochrome P450 76A2-like [Ipomoea nil]